MCIKGNVSLPFILTIGEATPGKATDRKGRVCMPLSHCQPGRLTAFVEVTETHGERVGIALQHAGISETCELFDRTDPQAVEGQL